MANASDFDTSTDVDSANHADTSASQSDPTADASEEVSTDASGESHGESDTADTSASAQDSNPPDQVVHESLTLEPIIVGPDDDGLDSASVEAADVDPSSSMHAASNDGHDEASAAHESSTETSASDALDAGGSEEADLSSEASDASSLTHVSTSEEQTDDTLGVYSLTNAERSQVAKDILQCFEANSLAIVTQGLLAAIGGGAECSKRSAKCEVCNAGTSLGRRLLTWLFEPVGCRLGNWRGFGSGSRCAGLLHLRGGEPGARRSPIMPLFDAPYSHEPVRQGTKDDDTIAATGDDNIEDWIRHARRLRLIAILGWIGSWALAYIYMVTAGGPQSPETVQLTSQDTFTIEHDNSVEVFFTFVLLVVAGPGIAGISLFFFGARLDLRCSGNRAD